MAYGAGNEFVNVAVEQLKQNGILSAAQLEWQKKLWELQGAPMLQIEKEKIALQAAQEVINAGMQALGLIGQLRGPRNAFQQQAVMHGVNQMGLSNIVDSIAGRFDLPSISGLFGNPEPATLQTLAADTRAAGGQSQGNTWFDMLAGIANRYVPESARVATGYTPATNTQYNWNVNPNTGWQYYPQPANGWQVGLGNIQYAPMPDSGKRYADLNNYDNLAQQQRLSGSGYTPAYSTSAEAYAKALPDPNKIVGRNWQKLNQDDRDFLLSAYEAKGLSANDVQDYIRKGLPQFRATNLGTVR